MKFQCLSLAVLTCSINCSGPPPIRITEFRRELPAGAHPVSPDSPSATVTGFDCRRNWSSYERALANALEKSPADTIGLMDVQFRVRIYGPFILSLECAEVEGRPVFAVDHR